MSKHTPGPWKSWLQIGGLMICPLMGRDPNIRVYAVNGRVRTIGKEEQEANANLIAAAPELLEACRALLQSGIPFAPLRLKVCNAIAKAEGRDTI